MPRGNSMTFVYWNRAIKKTSGARFAPLQHFAPTVLECTSPSWCDCSLRIQTLQWVTSEVITLLLLPLYLYWRNLILLIHYLFEIVLQNIKQVQQVFYCNWSVVTDVHSLSSLKLFSNHFIVKLHSPFFFAAWNNVRVLMKTLTLLCGSWNEAIQILTDWNHLQRFPVSHSNFYIVFIGIMNPSLTIPL